MLKKKVSSQHVLVICLNRVAYYSYNFQGAMFEPKHQHETEAADQKVQAVMQVRTTKQGDVVNIICRV